MDNLPAEKRERVSEIFNDRRRTNTQIGMLDCLMLHDRLRLLGKCNGAVRTLGYESSAEFRAWKERLVNLRDNLAHGGGLLDAEPDPLRAIELFDGVRSFAARLWELA